MFVGVRVAPVLAAAALVGVLAGCSGSSDEPRSLPPLSTTPVSTSSPAPPDTKTALAQAEAVVREYFQAINGLATNMDASALAALSLPSCPCRKFVRDVQRTAQKGREYFGHIRIVGLNSTFTAPQTIEVVATYDSSSGGARTTDGTVVYKGQPHHGTVENFVLARVAGRWKIRAIQLVRRGTGG